MNELDVIFRLALIAKLYPTRPDMIRARVQRLMGYAHPDSYGPLYRIARLKDPLTAITRIIEAY